MKGIWKKILDVLFLKVICDNLLGRVFSASFVAKLFFDTILALQGIKNNNLFIDPRFALRERKHFEQRFSNENSKWRTLPKTRKLLLGDFILALNFRYLKAETDLNGR